jgi:hypothetical protein
MFTEAVMTIFLRRSAKRDRHQLYSLLWCLRPPKWPRVGDHFAGTQDSACAGIPTVNYSVCERPVEILNRFVKDGDFPKQSNVSEN